MQSNLINIITTADASPCAAQQPCNQSNTNLDLTSIKPSLSLGFIRIIPLYPEFILKHADKENLVQGEAHQFRRLNLNLQQLE